MHEMKLNPNSFDRIRSGEKGFEYRLYDEKRRQLQLNDTIKFSRLPELTEQVTARIISLTPSASFADLYDQLHPQLPEETKEQFIQGKRAHYSEEEERTHGVLAIGLQLV